MRIFVVAMLVAAMGAGGCATIEHGSTDEVFVVSEPAGAKASSSSGGTCTTPCKFEVGRWADFSVTIEKTGFEARNIKVKTQSKASAEATSQQLTADYLGRAFDAENAANLVHDPNPIVVTLKPSGG